MEFQKVLSLIPSKLLEELALETEVDVFTKKLQGEVVFKLLLHCIVTHKDNSLRMMASAYETLFFRIINSKYQQGSIRFSSISTRLSVINTAYFEKLFEACVRVYKKELSAADKQNIMRFDSTIVALSTKLLNVGYQLKGGDAENYRQLKFTVGYSDIPEIVHFYTDQTHNSENAALRDTILKQAEYDITSIKVFDRGITARSTYDTFSTKGIQFISRINAKAKHDRIRKNNLDEAVIKTASLKIISDDWCQFYGERGIKPKHLFRRIEAIRIEDNEPINFITNITNLTASEITELYKRRWDIEVFFKFIKQLLNFKHLISRNENGIRVILYVTMIAAILLTAYKKLNHLNGYKIPKLKFCNELENEIVIELIKLCGGNPEKMKENLLHNTT